MTRGKDAEGSQPDEKEPAETQFQRFLRIARRVATTPKSKVEKRERERKLKDI